MTGADCQTCNVRQLNDALRKTGSGGSVVITRTLSARGEKFVHDAVSARREFDAFTPEDDPYGEHDFGQVTIEGETLFWKIDYYDPTMEFASDDPADPSKTARVLTLMLASDC